ncbi:succinate dehydrogenase, hydrophobic membrane anchor protein [Thiomicrorhabdus cannonii]|uniref:succinate dehydrogenase, hydrophobic membrane anchor protein n=1 Tax=Thiomicrorhabdus cannonii TaxID=2748011 RepID=UPI0015BA6091|nr:succinate dehydrogenase, hydrophobic membrane anchor protein [Thiomicrorhabdus cannonii]
MQLHRLSGNRAFRWQRISAFYLLLYTPLLALWITLTPHATTADNLIASLTTTWWVIPNLLALLLVITHAWVGLRDITLDYTPRQRTPLWLEALRWLLIAVMLNLALLLYWILL